MLETISVQQLHSCKEIKYDGSNIITMTREFNKSMPLIFSLNAVVAGIPLLLINNAIVNYIHLVILIYSVPMIASSLIVPYRIQYIADSRSKFIIQNITMFEGSKVKSVEIDLTGAIELEKEYLYNRKSILSMDRCVVYKSGERKYFLRDDLLVYRNREEMLNIMFLFGKGDLIVPM